MIKKQSLPMSKYGKLRRKWQSQYHLLGISFPQQVDQNHYYYLRKFKINIFYLADGKPHTKTVYFGWKNRPNKIDGVEGKNKRKDKSDLFHPYYWQKNLLDNKQTLEEAFAAQKKKLKI